MSYVLPTIRRVAVIGAGPGGLVAAKQLKEEGVYDKITVFERNDQIGGTWIYSPDKNNNPPLPSTNAIIVDPPTTDQVPPFQRLKSPIYAGLRTNLPKTVMCYRDFDFASNVPFFPSHTDVLTYLQQFTAAFDLEPLIRLNTNVVKAEYADEWTLTLQTCDQKAYTDTFDAVVVATGHYAIPYIPAVQGLDALEKNHVSWIHSREYRIPDDYKNQTVLVIGSGSSGLDIVRETSKVAKKVYHCVRTDNKQSLQAHALDAANVERVGLVQQILADGSIDCDKKLKVDQVIFATGYLYSFPFFPFEQDNLITDGQSVEHLHDFIFYTKNPTLAFIGLPIRIVPLPLSQSQATLIARCWNPNKPKVRLPTTTVQATGTCRKSFVLGVDSEFDYVDRLSAWAEGYQGEDQLVTWRNTSTYPLTCPLTDKWKQERIDALVLRKEYLGY
ncbi:hypothetical protein BC941DRAFT_433548 [Chlamydoabsidia padenii]|nr:hypothetical protein BC941DRAFT_433548 [Chlamydoabsidia padenii]